LQRKRAICLKGIILDSSGIKMDKMLNKTEKCSSTIMTKLHIGGVTLPPPQKKYISNSISYSLLVSYLLSVLCLFFFTTDGYGSEAQKKNSETPILQLEPFITNIGDRNRFLKLSISVELSSPDMAEKAKAKTGAIRDAIIMLITTKTSDAISSSEGKQQLKDEILMRLNQILGEGNVKNIYFTDFVMQ
jgi:flagellar basal body-associated protein FliL